MSWHDDIEWTRLRDPAAPGPVATALITPGLHAVWMHRIYSRLWKIPRLRPLASFIYHSSVVITRIDLHPEAIISSPIAIDHGVDVVIGSKACIGKRVLIYQGARIGVDGECIDARTLVDDDCVVGSGAKIVRGVKIGPRSKVGANALVITTVPPDSTAVGVPAQLKASDREDISTAQDLIDPALLI